MKRSVFLLLCLLLWAFLSLAQESERFLGRLVLPSGETIVVEEPDCEARSLGSFSIRVYDPARPGDSTTFFRTGRLELRDGSIETIQLADVDGDTRADIVVLARSVGTGNYISAWAFSYMAGTLKMIARVGMLLDSAEPIESLRKSLDLSER